MRPIRLTLADVQQRLGAGCDLPESEMLAALDWLWLREEVGHHAPAPLPRLPGASESARCVWSLLSLDAGDRCVLVDPVGTLCRRLGWEDPEPPAGIDVSGWRVVADFWLLPPIAELVERKAARWLGDGSLLLLRVA